jgi:hypothetical protein
MSETREELIQRITEEVLAVLKGHDKSSAVLGRNGINVLVAGNPDRLPDYLCKDCELYTMEDYIRESDISKYQRVYIESLTLAELCDIALCRDSQPTQRAVIYALLSGKEVLLLESGLPHRSFSAKSNFAMHTVLEGYLRTIIRFGAKLVSDISPSKPVKVSSIGIGRSNSVQLITEKIAMDMVQSGGQVKISKEAILTPSAKDVLFSAGVDVVRE